MQRKETYTATLGGVYGSRVAFCAIVSPSNITFVWREGVVRQEQSCVAWVSKWFVVNGHRP